MLADAQSRAPLALLDLRDLTFMDSEGVHAIVNASAAARELGHRLVLLRGPPHIDRVFRLTGTAENVDLQAAADMLARQFANCRERRAHRRTRAGRGRCLTAAAAPR